jgi:myosin heavy subunit
MSTRNVRPTPRWRLLWSALVFAGGVAAALGLSGGANAQAAIPGVGSGEPAKQESSSDGQDLATVDDVDYELLLGRLLASQKSRQFLADLEVLIRRSDSQEASGFLSDALEAGTIAALLMKRVKSPGLLAFLETLEKPQPSASTIAGAASAENPMAESRRKELAKALESETTRANAAAQELEALRADLSARDAKDASRTTELQQRTEERIAAAMRERDALREQLASRRDGSPKLAELAASAEREKARAEAAITALEVERSAIAASEAKLIEAQDALERERRRAAQATTALEASHREIEKLRAGADQAGQLSEALAREKGRADAAAQELGRLKGELAGLRRSESRLAEASASLESERRRAKAAVAEAALLKSEQAKLLSKSAELEQAVKREKQRADAAARELAARKQDPSPQAKPVASQ